MVAVHYHIQKAADMLFITNLKLCNTATSCGFHDISYFIKNFIAKSTTIFSRNSALPPPFVALKSLSHLHHPISAAFSPAIFFWFISSLSYYMNLAHFHSFQSIFMGYRCYSCTTACIYCNRYFRKYCLKT